VKRATTVKFRHHSAIAIAGLVTLIGAVPLVAAAPYTAPIALVPLAVAIWAWRAGTDAGPEGLRVRALLGTRRLAWAQINEILPLERRQVAAILADDTAVVLPAVSPADLPRLAAAAPHRAG
jgi:hypothetical protein